jgi:uncharacterized protein YcnI
MIRARGLAVAALAIPTAVLAHAVVFPRTSAPGAYEKYVPRVPNEKDVPTTRVEIRFPASVRVVSFADVAGWQLQVQTDTARRITAATWTGTLPPERFVEFPFVAVNPREATRLVWPVYQTYADGERVAWVGPEDGDEPASVTVIRRGEEGGSPWDTYVSLGALVVALMSLGIAVGVTRRQRSLR